MTTCLPISMNSVNVLRAEFEPLLQADESLALLREIPLHELMRLDRDFITLAHRHQEPPAFANNGGPWTTWLMLGGRRPPPGRRELAELMLDSMRIFAKFHEKILIGEASAQLTAREVEVVKWTSEGKTSAEIAIILGLSEHTVISHITSAARKLKAVNRVHMIAIAVRKGIVH